MSSSATRTTQAAELTALAGISTPLGELALPLPASGQAIATVTVHSGVLMADLGQGAAVRGNGTPTLRISGSVDQITAKLSKLAYLATAPGSDEISVQIVGTTFGSVTRAVFPLTVVPLAGPIDPAATTVAINQGTLLLEARTLDGPVIVLTEPAGSDVSTTAILVNTTIGPRSTVAIVNDNVAGDLAPRLAIAGRVELDGRLILAGQPTTITLAKGSTLANDGVIDVGPHAAFFTGTGRLLNDGQILVSGDGSAAAPVRIDTRLEGTGQLRLDGGATLTLGGAVAPGETVELGTGANTLHLSQLAAFGATVAGFSSGDRIVLDGAAVTSATYSGNADARTGTLTLMNGAAVAGQIQFTAPATNSIFQLGQDASGNAIITLEAVAPAHTGDTVDIYRFFDTRTGTQLLTPNGAERDSILATRPDLRLEGVGLHAFARDDADGDTAAVYRFFDSGNGTHFMTASATERDSVLAHRPDLVFEPNGTFFEHASAHAGDVPVYRFFDSTTGAHLFTADAGERGTILATRTDLVGEGIAFYAPG